MYILSILFMYALIMKTIFPFYPPFFLVGIPPCTLALLCLAILILFPKHQSQFRPSAMQTTQLGIYILPSFICFFNKDRVFQAFRRSSLEIDCSILKLRVIYCSLSASEITMSSTNQQRRSVDHKIILFHKNLDDIFSANVGTNKQTNKTENVCRINSVSS